MSWWDMLGGWEENKTKKSEALKFVMQVLLVYQSTAMWFVVILIFLMWVWNIDTLVAISLVIIMVRRRGPKKWRGGELGIGVNIMGRL